MALRPLLLSICLTAALCSGLVQAQTRCVDESPVAAAGAVIGAVTSSLSSAVTNAGAGAMSDATPDASADEPGAFASDPVDPRATLRSLVHDALDRSPGAGLPADAEAADLTDPTHPSNPTQASAGLAPGAALSMREQLAINTVVLALQRSR